MNDLNGNYHLKITRDPMSWQLVPDSYRIFVDGGALIIYNEDDSIVMAVGNGEWIEVIHNDVFMRFYPEHTDYGDLSQ